MALTGEQRAKVRMYLGWPARFHSTDNRLESAMDALASTPDDEALVVGELARCESIDTQIAGTDKTAQAVELGSISLRAGYQLGVLRARGRQAAARMAAILGVPIRSDAFSAGGPVGFAGPSGPES